MHQDVKASRTVLTMSISILCTGTVSNLSTKDEQDEPSTEGTVSRNLGSMPVQGWHQHVEMNGARTEERLARELNLELKTITSYVRALRRGRLVTTGYTKRGSTLVKLRKRAKPSTDENAA